MRDNKNSKMTIIKGITISFLFAGSTVVLAKDDCADLTGCAKKACEVNHQLLTAKRQGNSHQAAGLNKALNKKIILQLPMSHICHACIYIC